ncbi:MAG: nuclear transport factor 2 family protein [Myxococcota bacterium]|nr:nuclear transport factor 2 family protein [Myxococcota bacterium]
MSEEGSAALDPRVRELLDRAEISDVLHRYATGLDRRNWELYRSIFTNEVDLDFESVGIPAGVRKADAWVRSARALFAGFTATQHTSSNHVHEIRGDRARCVSNMQAEHFVGDGEEDRWTIGGYYTNELVRTPSGWKLSKVTLNVTWQRGNPRVSEIALRRGRELAEREPEAAKAADPT